MAVSLLSCCAPPPPPQVVTKGKARLPAQGLEPGVTLELGNYVCEIDHDLDYEAFK